MIYLDTSVALAHLRAEDRRPPDALWRQPLVASRLLEHELWTRLDAQRLGASHGELARRLAGFLRVFFTGGEPFILNDIYEMLRYSAERIRTTVLTNGMLLRGWRMERLREIASPNLLVQVSLDGARPEDHDPYRGDGTWVKTVEGIRLLQEHGFHVRLSTTETPANSERLDNICEIHRGLGIPEEDHFVRSLAKRGFSTEGLELSLNNLA